MSPNATEQIPAIKEYLKRLADAQEKAAELLQKAQEVQAIQYNRKQQEAPAFNKGELVWLLRKYIETKQPSTKLDDKKLGPFKIMGKIRTLAKRLELPATMKIHPVFHISFLDPF